VAVPASRLPPDLADEPGTPAEDREANVDEVYALLARPAWHADAACREHPEIDFFPSRGQSTASAKKVCAGCLVREECLGAAMHWREKHGIWGGLSERERRRARRDAGGGTAEFDEQSILEAYADGLSMAVVADRLQLAPGLVARVVRAAGIARTRPRRRACGAEAPLTTQPASDQIPRPGRHREVARAKAEILREIAGLGPALPGSLVARRTRCGKQNCRCADGELHGPYYTWTFKAGDQVVNQAVQPDEADRHRAGIANGRRLRRLLAELEALGVQTFVEDKAVATG